jgi:hypothetical protein
VRAHPGRLALVLAFETENAAQVAAISKRTVMRVSCEASRCRRIRLAGFPRLRATRRSWLVLEKVIKVDSGDH